MKRRAFFASVAALLASRAVPAAKPDTYTFVSAHWDFTPPPEGHWLWPKPTKELPYVYGRAGVESGVSAYEYPGGEIHIAWLP